MAPLFGILCLLSLMTPLAPLNLEALATTLCLQTEGSLIANMAKSSPINFSTYFEIVDQRVIKSFYNRIL